MQAIIIDLAGVHVFCLQDTQTKCRLQKLKILLCTQCRALFCPTVGPMILRSRWGPSVGQQGPRCGYQKGISFNATKHKLKLDLASVMVFKGLTKMPPKCLKLPKPQSSAKKHRGKTNHKGDRLQLWSVENMRNALVPDSPRIQGQSVWL